MPIRPNYVDLFGNPLVCYPTILVERNQYPGSGGTYYYYGSGYSTPAPLPCRQKVPLPLYQYQLHILFYLKCAIWDDLLTCVSVPAWHLVFSQVATCTSSDCDFYVTYDGILSRSASCNAAECTGVVQLDNKRISQITPGVFDNMISVSAMWVCTSRTWNMPLTSHLRCLSLVIWDASH